LVVPRYNLSVSINLDHLEGVIHNETNIVVSLAIINVFYIVVNGGVGLVPRHGRICCSYLVKRDERGNGTVRWVQLHHNWLLITETKHEELAVIVDLTTRDSRNGIGNVVEELTPFPVTVKVNSISETMVIGGWDVILGGGVTSNDDLLVSLIKNGTADFLILGTSRGDREQLLFTLG
jgi:hypothetical protein